MTKAAVRRAATQFEWTPELDHIVQREFGKDPLARVIMGRFLEGGGYRDDLARELFEMAAGARGVSWEFRRASVLMLEHQVLLLRPVDRRAHEQLFEWLGVRYDRADAEGYSRTDLAGFIAEFRRRLARLSGIHSGIRGGRTTARALAGFLHVARQECKLTLARYLFTPEEVARRIASAVLVSDGLPQWAPESGNGPQTPPYERQIVNALRSAAKIYWTARGTCETINALVEAPLGTVVLVIKLPGSDLEFEIKRTGIRGWHPLSVRTDTHRLYGGSIGSSHHVEALSGARFSEVYRRVHRHRPPLSATLQISSIQSIPAWRGNAHLLTYLTDRATFGNGYRLMRAAMKEELRYASPREPELDAAGPLGLTVRFLKRMPPQQAWLEGTSSFRLSLLDRYLSDSGPSTYFTRGLVRDHTGEDASLFADDLLEEILGVYSPPCDSGGTYVEYIDNALAEPANRARADRLFVKHMREIGRVWGTLLGTGGHSYGESFVTRNVGLKSRWRNGRWTVEIVHMDHDVLWVPGSHPRDFNPKRAMEAMRIDEGYIFEEESAPHQERGATGSLRRIYRAGPAVCAKGRAALEKELVSAYHKTRGLMVHSPRVRELFSDEFIARIAAWESLAWSRLQARRRKLPHEAWVARAKQLLAEGGCEPNDIDDWIAAADGAADFLDRYSRLFDPRYRGRRKSKE